MKERNGKKKERKLASYPPKPAVTTKNKEQEGKWSLLEKGSRRFRGPRGSLTNGSIRAEGSRSIRRPSAAERKSQ